jgi:hypothetical protein
MKRLILIAALIMGGCTEENDSSVLKENQINGQNPEFVANTLIGKLYRITISRGDKFSDRVYYIDNNTNNSVTVNSSTKHGNTAVLIINGVEYVPKND